MKKAAVQIESPKSKTDEAYRSLREMIFTGQIKPGQRLTEAKAVSLTGLSRGTIRESLVKLEADGLIGKRGSGCIRTVLDAEDMTTQDMLDHFEVREGVEGKAAYAAAINMTDEQIATLRKLAEETDRLIQDPEADSNERRAKHTDLHTYLVSNCGNRLAYRMWKNFNLVPIGARTVEFQHKLSLQPSSVVRTALFTNVVDQIERRDPDAAQKAMEQNIRNATYICRVLLEEEQRLKKNIKTSIGGRE